MRIVTKESARLSLIRDAAYDKGVIKYTELDLQKAIFFAAKLHICL